MVFISPLHMTPYFHKKKKKEKDTEIKVSQNERSTRQHLGFSIYSFLLIILQPENYLAVVKLYPAELLARKTIYELTCLMFRIIFFQRKEKKKIDLHCI